MSKKKKTTLGTRAATIGLKAQSFNQFIQKGNRNLAYFFLFILFHLLF
jgi:hypothetical protein